MNKLLGYVELNPDLLCLFDTSISSLNLGDEIINSCGKDVLETIFPEKQFLIASTHNGISGKIITDANNSGIRIVCGSNLLHPKLASGRGSWNIGFLDVIRMKKVLLMGAGWSNYSGRVGYINKLFYKLLLSQDGVHSVRDEYTKRKLGEMGVHNVINTGCPTMWGLDPKFCNKIRVTKASKAVFTLTDYDKDPENDKYMVKTLLEMYESVYFWPQGSGDLSYFKELAVEGVVRIAPRLSSYDELLNNGDIDFVGTRLHGGIRALQYMQRAIIVSIDNRAREKAKDFGLPIIERSCLKQDLKNRIIESRTVDIKIDSSSIDKWRSQFGRLS
ncbi:polysaccharide pyruvyl transferase family protein [Pseudomonas saliphila]|uniref:polysaccharide pyruvyl transferase family protein n=1 Tax=Pseudomonas saliphila TaxID=2586906 RepID=UPI0015B4EBD6|nr:polysaccharide pyruvyl transferase family protein [Pseudomonas saliphila]